MGPEEFYHLNRLKNRHTLFEMRVRSLKWMLDCFLKGTIRRNTIINLIPLCELEDLLDYMVECERYEDCVIIRDVIEIIYKQNTKINMSEKRQLEIIELLSSTIKSEREKVNKNSEVIFKLEKKLEEVKNWRPTNNE